MLREGPLPLPRAAAIGAQLAACLRDRHAAGLGPHRSVGPAKVLVRWDSRGEPVVRLLDPDGSAELPYLAPEQWDGRPVDERADVYATGAVVFHMVQGVPPPKGKDRTSPPPLAGVPEPLGGLLKRALWPAVELRPGTAVELFEGLAGSVAALRGGRAG
jgi:serine/threonine protein kinase